MAVGVEGLDGARVTEARLRRFHALAVSDEQVRVVMANGVEACPRRERRRLNSSTPLVAERLPAPPSDPSR